MLTQIPACPVAATVPARALLRGDRVVVRKGTPALPVAALTKGAAAVYIEFEDGSTMVALRHDRIALAN